MAFVFNLATYMFIRETSALTCTVGSNSMKILLIFLSALQAQVRNPLSWTGIGVVITSIVAYAYFSHAAAQAAAAGAPPPPPGDPKGDAGKGGAEPTERTPLLKSA